VNRVPRSERAEIVALSIYFAAAERGKPVTRGANRTVKVMQLDHADHAAPAA